jgi:hypothetical protein
MPHSQEMAAVPEESNDPETFPVKHAVERDSEKRARSNFLGEGGGRARKAVLRGHPRQLPLGPAPLQSRTSDNCM